MPNLRSNGIQIEYDTFGDRFCPPLLLIMGFGGQMILWDEEFDNRDAGLSSKLEEMGEPRLAEISTAGPLVVAAIVAHTRRTQWGEGRV